MTIFPHGSHEHIQQRFGLKWIAELIGFTYFILKSVKRSQKI